MTCRKKWVRFDLHLHTFRSDGFNSTRKMLMTAKKIGLDVVAITDHNVPNKLTPQEAFEKYGIVLIPGFELSFLKGHLLILGIDEKIVEKKIQQWKIKPRKTGVIARKKTILKILKWCNENGAFVVAAHPRIPTGTMSLKKNFLIKLVKMGLVQAMEVHNDGLEKQFKKRLYWLWQRRVKKTARKLKILTLANSDAHFWWRLGNRFNMVKLDDPQNLLTVLKKGKVEIKHSTRSDL